MSDHPLAVARVVDLFRNRAERPWAIGYLQSFGMLSVREKEIVAQLMACAAIEVEHANEEDIRTRMVNQRRQNAHRLALRSSFRAVK